MKEKNIVSNASKGYNYNYASLADIANQGFPIPKMKTGTENEKEYVYYFDTELSEWIRGAEVVIPDGKGMNKAQLYGSALTYARRYTVLMADQLASGDDVQIENEVLFNEPSEKQLKALADEFRKLYTNEEQVRILNGLKKVEAEEIGFENLQKYVNFKKYGEK